MFRLIFFASTLFGTCLNAATSENPKTFAASEFALDAAYKVETVWATAYQVAVTLTNNTDVDTTSWTSTFSMPEGYVLSTHVFSGIFTKNGQNVTVTNLPGDGIIEAGESLTYKMIINMPRSASTVINNLQAVANGSITPVPTPVPAAPVLNAITRVSTQSYTVSWKSATNATSYTLQQSTSSNFANPTVVAEGNVLSKTFSNVANGTYYYRVLASNAEGNSPYSNVQNITISVSPSPTVPTTPVLNAITRVSAQSYTVSWRASTNATSYTLQQSTSSNFANPTVVAEGNVLSKTFSNVANGTYYYRVLASNTAGKSPYSNVQSIVISVSPSPTVPTAPVLNAITRVSTQSYTVSWKAATNATSYTLQQSTSSNFANPTVVAEGNVLSKTFSNVADGTYYYRVLASNTAGKSPYSNVQNITISQPVPPTPAGAIEHSVWYIDWTSWFTGPTFVLPSGVNMINLFVGELRFENGKPTMGGFGTMTNAQLDAFTAYCRAQSPPIAVKVSIGGGGGMYDRCWDRLTAANIDDFAQGMADFCRAHGVVGVDFDYEAFASSEQEALVGNLIKAFKLIDPNFQTSLCTNAGFGPNYPWQKTVKNILDAATIAPGKNAVDRLYIMSYYNSMQEEINWIVGPDGNGGWANWAIQNYGFTPARISVGIDDFDAHAYDPDAFRAWAASKGFSTAHWAFDPAHPK